jgi:GWxTD domain-containing protein
MPVVNALGWALLHFLWEGALIALVLTAALPFCRGAQARYGAAGCAVLAMLLAFGVTVAVSIPGQPAAVPPPWAMAGAAHPGAGSGIAARTPGALEYIAVALPRVVPFWMAGALLIGLYRFGGWMAAQRLRRAGVCAAPPRWQDRLGRLAKRIGVSRPLVLLESGLAEVPLVIGHLRPAILVPLGLLAGLPVQHVEAILLHELAHIRRSDYLVNLMQTLVESLLFYHPAVWWISGLLRTERENCCDDLAVAIQGDARGYAAALVTLEERRQPGREPALAATGGNLMNRIRRLLNQPEKPRAAAALIISMGLLLGMFCLFAAAQQTKPDSQPEMQTSYDKWLNEDVVYIIRAEERAAFQGLRTDEERQKFIEQFWLRRDPTPDTPENEFKEEHYRRIAYANSHWGLSGTAGWRTDRGRIYIVYGPPDEIESHPAKGLEQWLYRHIDGIGDRVIVEYTDPKHTGDYRHTKDPSVK